MSHVKEVRVPNDPEMDFNPKFCDGCQRRYCSGPCLQMRNRWMQTEKQIEEKEIIC